MAVHKTIGRNLLFTLTSNVGGTIIGAVRTFMLARYLSPAEYGVLNIINLILSYSNYADVGTNTGMLYRSSTLIGEGLLVDAANVRKQVMLFTLYLSIVLSVVFLTLSVSSIQMVKSYETNLFFVGIGIPLFLILNYFHVEARILENFRVITIATILGAIASLIITALIVTYYSGGMRVEASVGAGLAGTFLAVVVFFFYLRVPLVRELDFRLVGKLIRLGLPLTIVPITYVIFQSVDRWVISGSVSDTDFGYYAFGTTIGMMLTMLPNTLGVVLTPRLIQRFGRSREPKDSSKIVLASLWISAYVMAIVAGGVIIVMPYLLSYVFPTYLPGINVIDALIVANCFLFSVPVASSFLLASEKKRLLLLIYCVSILLEGFLVFAALKFFGIEWASYSVMLCDLLLALCMACVSVYLVVPEWRTRRIFGLFLPFIVCLTTASLLASGLSVTGGAATDMFEIVKSCSLYLLYCGVFCITIAWLCGIQNDLPIIDSKILT
jgi:O-antigen/teichoic acid export membrane protein